MIFFYISRQKRLFSATGPGPVMMQVTHYNKMVTCNIIVKKQYWRRITGGNCLKQNTMVEMKMTLIFLPVCKLIEDCKNWVSVWQESNEFCICSWIRLCNTKLLYGYVDMYITLFYCINVLFGCYICYFVYFACILWQKKWVDCCDLNFQKKKSFFTWNLSVSKTHTY